MADRSRAGAYPVSRQRDGASTVCPLWEPVECCPGIALFISSSDLTVALERRPERLMSMIPIMPLSSCARMWQWNTVVPTKRLKCIRILTSPRGGSGTTSCSLLAL
jgi:hypothetical protein